MKGPIVRSFQIFDFLDFSIRTTGRQGRHRCVINSSKKCMSRFKDKIHDVLSQDPAFVGWANYFEDWSAKEPFSTVDSTIHKMVEH